jgi:hypothetical protein
MKLTNPIIGELGGRHANVHRIVHDAQTPHMSLHRNKDVKSRTGQKPPTDCANLRSRRAGGFRDNPLRRLVPPGVPRPDGAACVSPPPPPPPVERVSTDCFGGRKGVEMDYVECF